MAEKKGTRSRELSQAETREALLQGGETLLGTGIHRVTVRSVCALAGFTSGAFYSNFPSRTVFLSALGERVAGRLLAGIRRATTGITETGPDALETRCTNWLSEVSRDRETVQALIELARYARQDEAFHAEYALVVSAFRNGLAVALADLFASLKREPAVSFEQMANGLISVRLGLTLHSGLLHGSDEAVRSLVLFLSEFFRNSRPLEAIH